MATEVLVNDGGAPARILPYTAGSALTAGRVVTMATDGEIDHAASGATYVLGAAFVDANSGNTASVITGRGVVLQLSVSGNVAISPGTTLDVANAGAGILQSGTSNKVAVALESVTSGSVSTIKCQIIR
jgi:hypothetical protein